MLVDFVLKYDDIHYLEYQQIMVNRLLFLRDASRIVSYIDKSIRNFPSLQSLIEQKILHRFRSDVVERIEQNEMNDHWPIMVSRNIYHALLISRLSFKTMRNDQRELLVNKFRCRYRGFENILEGYFVLIAHNLERDV